MRPGATILRALTALLFVVMLVWIVSVAVMLGGIYISKSIPFGFDDWIVSVQSHGYWPGEQPHSQQFYILRFYLATALVLLLGSLSALYLRRGSSGKHQP